MDIFNQETIVFIEENALFVLLLLIWSIVWKGLALWRAARLSHKWWFVIILLVNAVGILEIIYIFFVANKYKVESEDAK